MAPMHEWKDDAEFLRYNREPQKKWWHPIANFLGGLTAILFMVGIIVAGFAAAINDAQTSCYRGTARSYDSESPNARLIDVELDYSRRHPECQADWTPAKRREAERYWRYTDTLNQADAIMRGDQ
jgi:hypothetical protein